MGEDCASETYVKEYKKSISFVRPRYFDRLLSFVVNTFFIFSIISVVLSHSFERGTISSFLSDSPDLYHIK